MAEGMEHSSHEPWYTHEQRVAARAPDARFCISPKLPYALSTPLCLPKSKEEIRSDFLDSPVFDTKRLGFLEQLLSEKLYNYKEKCFELNDADVLQVLRCLHFPDGNFLSLKEKYQHMESAEIISKLSLIMGTEKAKELEVGGFFEKRGQGIEFPEVTAKRFFDMFEVSEDEIRAMCVATQSKRSDIDAIRFRLVITHDSKNPVRGFTTHSDPKRIGINFGHPDVVREVAIQEFVHVIYGARWKWDRMDQHILKEKLSSIYTESYMQAETSKTQEQWKEAWSDSFRDDRIFSEYRECITDLTMVRMCLELGDYHAVKKEMDRIAGQLKDFDNRQKEIKKHPNRYIPSYKLNTDVFCTLLGIPLTNEKMLPSAEFVPYQRTPESLYADLQTRAQRLQSGKESFMIYGKTRADLIQAVDAAIKQITKVMDASRKASPVTIPEGISA